MNRSSLSRLEEANFFETQFPCLQKGANYISLTKQMRG